MRENFYSIVINLDNHILQGSLHSYHRIFAALFVYKIRLNSLYTYADDA